MKSIRRHIGKLNVAHIKLGIFIVYTCGMVFLLEKRSYESQSLLGFSSLLVSLVFLLYGRGVGASNIGMAFFVSAMFLLMHLFF